MRCERCARVFPVFGTIPCLLPDVELWRALQLSKLGEYLWVTDTRIREFSAEAESPGRLDATRQRLRRMVQAKENERRVIQSLFESLKEGTAPSSPDVPVRGGAEGKRLPLLDCYENVFRDWVWGEPELNLSEAMLERALGATSGAASDLVAVYGAGAGKLALNLHQHFAAKRTLALDLNPLPLLIADSLLAGESVDLYEFPVAPTLGEHVAVRHHLEHTGPAPSGLSFVFADANHPPCLDGSVDLLVTPWFIDAVRCDLRVTAAGINRVLKPGGTWLNIGPLQFDMELSRCYAIEEAHEIVALSGFELQHTEQQDLPYFESPYSGSLRTDTVFAFAAKKVSEAAPFEPVQLSAAWLRDPNLPIPLGPEMSVMGRRSAFTAAALSLVDGRRSIADLSEALAASAGTTPASLLPQLQAFFAKLPIFTSDDR